MAEKLKNFSKIHDILTDGLNVCFCQVLPGNDQIACSDNLHLVLGGAKDEYHNLDDVLDRFIAVDKSRVEQAMKDFFNGNRLDLPLVVKLVKSTEDTREHHFLNIKLLEIENESREYYLVFQDISHLKKTIEDISKTKAKNRSLTVDKLKTGFLNNLSHEIRRPMNAIMGFTELLNLTELSPADKEKYINIIQTNGKFLLKLVDDISEVSKFVAGNLDVSNKEFELNPFMDELFTQFTRLIDEKGKEHLEIRFVKSGAKPVLNSDIGRIHQVFNNLFSNAIKFTNKGYIEFGYQLDKNNGHVVFFMKDSGIGLSEKEQKNIFDRFGSTEDTMNPNLEGIGLGLTICKVVVESLGGKIWVESTPNKGSEFYFSIPYQRNVRQVADNKGMEENVTIIEDKPAYSWKDKVVLVVEDEEVNRIFLEAVLQATEVQVIHASTGEQAIELVNSIGKIDLILMDIKLPEMDGFAAIREIKKMKSGIPIIAQTAFINRNEQSKCFQAGCDDYISKPIDIELLLQKMDALLNDKF